ncbi:hypothetical protein ACVCAH_21615 [Micromonospora sp. LZ34]
MARHGLHRLTRPSGPRRKAVLLGVLGTAVVAGLSATMMPLLAADDFSVRASADTTATAVPQDGDNSVKSTLATCPARCDGNPRGAREAVIRFTVGGLPANAVNVRSTLRVHAWQRSAATVTAHASRLDARAARPAPVPAGATLDTVSGVARGFNEWDVSELVRGNGSWTVSLAQTGPETRTYWASSENREPDLRPRLVVRYDVGTRPDPVVTTPASPSAAPTTSAPRPTPSPSPNRATPSPTPSAPTAGCGQVSDKLVPFCGAWWWMYSPADAGDGWDHGRAVAEVEAQVGRKFDIVHRYHDFSKPAATAPSRTGTSSSR